MSKSPENEENVVNFKVEGMSCADCSLRFETSVLMHTHIHACTISMLAGKCKITAKQGMSVPVEDIIILASKLGFSAERMIGDSEAVYGQLLVDLCTEDKHAHSHAHAHAHSGSRLHTHSHEHGHSHTSKHTHAHTHEHKESETVDELCSEISNISGVQSARVEKGHVPHKQKETGFRANAAILIVYDAQIIGARTILEKINERTENSDLCASVSVCDGNVVDASEAEIIKTKWRLFFALALTLLSLTFAFVIPETGAYDHQFSGFLSPRVVCNLILACLCVFVYWVPLVSSSINSAVVAKTITMDTLVAISAGTAFFFSIAVTIAASVHGKEGESN
jgi:cation transport ATPase